VATLKELRTRVSSIGSIERVTHALQLVAAAHLRRAQQAIDGSCSVLILTHKGVYAARDLHGRTPLIIGEKDGSYCATLETCAFPNLGYEPLRVTSEQVKRLEAEIDQLNAELAPLTSFVLPGGTPTAAHLHVARTVSRRAERLMVELASHEDESVSEAALQYINRLSDFLFVAGRYVNDRGAGDVLWVPGKNR